MRRRFRDRAHAGVEMAELLSAYRGVDGVVLGLPRGGVAVAAPIADALDLPLDAYVVRKLGVPGHEELAMGAIASGGVVVWNPDVVEPLRIGQDRRDAVVDRERAELERREREYRGDREPIAVHGPRDDRRRRRARDRSDHGRCSRRVEGARTAPHRRGRACRAEGRDRRAASRGR